MVDEVKNHELVIAGSGGGGKQSGGKEANDTLKSRSKLVFVDVIGEGQIGGLVNDERSVFFDDTPLKNSVGEYNFSGISWAMSHGTQDQEPLSNGYIDNIEYVTSRNVKVTNENPVSFTITDPNADAVRVILSVPALTHSDDKGNINGSSVAFSFDISVNNGAYVSFANSEISGKTRSKYQKSFYGQLPLTDSNNNKARRWTIRIRKTTKDSTSSSTQNDLYLDSYATIISSKLSYPNTAIFGASIDSEFFSSMPKRSYLVDGLLIKIPANRNAQTRTYEGIWNGQYKLESSDNPAWILFDLISNERYGLGQYIPAEFRNPARLYEIGKYCDEMVDDGFGGKEPRFSINTVISSLADAYQLLTDITSVFNGMVYWTGNDMGYMCDMPSEVSMLYTKANIIGDISYQSSDRKDRHSVAVISYNNPERNYEMEQEYIEDQDLISRFGVRKTEITAFGCTTRGQAHRVGKWLLYTEKYQSSVITFNVGIDSAFVFPGDIIQIADPDRAGKRLGGRLFGFTDKSAVLDDNIDLSVFPNSTILVRANDGSLIKRKIKTSYIDRKSGKTAVTWEVPIQKSVVKGAIWVISSPNLEPITARVVSVTQVDGKDTEYSISAIRHLESKFNYIESDIALEIPKTSLIEHYSIDGTNSVSIIGEKKSEQGITLYSMNIQWEQVKNAQYYLVKYRKENGNWIELPHQNSLSINVDGVYSGKYEAGVIAVSTLGAKSRPVLSALTTIDGTASILPKIALLETKGVLFGIDLNWSFAQGTTGVAYTEIQQKRNEELDWEFLSNVVYPTNEYSLSGLTSVESRVFRVRVVDNFGITSEWSDEVGGTSSADPQAVLDILEGQINESTLDNILTGKINTAVTTGTANTQAILAEQQARTQAVTAEAQARATAISNEAKARTAEINQRVIALNSEIGTTLAGLQNGLTQEIQQRKDGDSQTLSALNAYKVSNDNAVSTILAKADNAISVNNAQASQINALQASVTTVQSGLSTKLDSSAISNYYTKAQADEKIQQVTTGKIEEFNANLNIGGVNILPNSHIEKTGTNEHLYYAILPELKEFYLNNPTVTISFDIKVPVAGRVQVYSGNNSGVYFVTNINVAEVNVFKRYSVTVNPKPHYASPNNQNGTLEFWGVYGTGRIPTVKNVKIESGNKATAWTPALADTQAKFDTHAQAISTINSNVSNLNNTLTSQSQQLTQLRNDLTATNANVSTKADTTALNTLDSRVTQQGENITSQSSKIAQLENILDTVNQNLNTKATASALDSLDSKVTTLNHTVVSQGQTITQLNNNLTAINANVTQKADSTALTALDNKVTQVDNRITSESQKITQLTATVNQNQANLTSQYYTKADADTMASGKVEQFKASLDSDSLVYDYLSNHADSWVSFYPEIDLANDIQVIDDGKVSKTVYRKSSSQPNSWNYNKKGLPNNQRYKLSMWVRRSVDSIGYCYFTVLLRNSNEMFNPRTSNYTSHNLSLPSDNQWHFISAVVDFSSRPFDVVHFGFAINHMGNVGNAEMQGFKVEKVLSVNDVDNTFASSQALTALDNKVTQQGGNIISQANQITALQSGLNTANQNIATKLDSSAIVNYYTKAETDNVIGGKVEQFKATLDNTSLLPDPNMTDVNSWRSHYSYGMAQYFKTVADGKIAPTVFRKDKSTPNACWNYSNTAVPNTKSYKLSAWVRRANTSAGLMYFTYRFLNSAQGANVFLPAQYGYVGVSVQADNNWHFVTATVDLTSRADIAKIFFGFAIGHNTSSDYWELQGFKCEPVLSSNDMDNTVATAAALQQTNTNVSNLNGQLTTQAQQITTLTTQQNSQSTTISQQTQTINGISAVRAVTVDNNGVISGYGLMSELRNGRVTSQFGVNADTFYIGSPTNGKKPFIFNTSPRVIDGVSYPAGAWINSAYIANATIKMAHIQDSIQSDNYVAGRSGWRLFKNGTLEINGSLGDGTRVQLNHRGLVGYYANGVKAFELGIFG